VALHFHAETEAAAQCASHSLNRIVCDCEAARRDVNYRDGDNQVLTEIQKIALNATAAIYSMLNTGPSEAAPPFEILDRINALNATMETNIIDLRRTA
jgi:hypothetical protein